MKNHGFLKPILIAVIIIAIAYLPMMILKGCTKEYDEHFWKCVNILIVTTKYRVDTIRNEVYHPAMTHEELNIFIAQSTFQTLQIHDGDSVLIDSSIESCGETVCPE
jgi:hypothetical protein